MLFKCYKVRPHSESGRPVCHHFLGVYTKETNSRILLSCQQPSVNHTHRPDTTFSDFLLAQSQLDFGGGGVWSSIKILRPHRVGGRRSDPIKKKPVPGIFLFFFVDWKKHKSHALNWSMLLWTRNGRSEFFYWFLTLSLWSQRPDFHSFCHQVWLSHI